jgi:guanylate kinase
MLVVVSGPSGAGKSTICARLLDEFDEFEVSVSTTTREPREGETDGVSYHFVSHEEFRRLRDEDEFIEWAEVHDNFYGTSKSVVEDALEDGRSLLFDIDYQGAENLKKAVDSAVLIMLLPPDMDTLEERLQGRGTDSDAVIATRLDNAAEEIGNYELFDYVVINEDLGHTYDLVRAIVLAERARVERNSTLIHGRFPTVFED